MVKIKKLTKKYKDNVIYQDASYSFNNNSLTCFYGESGSGKTTLFNILAGFDTDFKGEVNVNGVSVEKLNQNELASYRAESIGFVFQSYHLLKGYTVLENVLMALYQNTDLNDDEKETKALEVISSLNLIEEAHQKIETLSGGQKQRVSVARALVNDPKVILADEPTGALDLENSKIIMDILKDIAREKTVIVITHDEEILNYGDEVITLENNKIRKVTGAYVPYSESIDESKEVTKELILPKKYISKLAIKNVKINSLKYILSAIMLAVSITAFIASFSLNTINEVVMTEFQNKNFHYTVGQIDDFTENSIDKVYDSLNTMEGVTSVYLQGSIKDTVLKVQDKEIPLKFNGPSLIAKETLSYGSMPMDDNEEIALSASLAGMLNTNIKELIGENLLLKYNDASNIEKTIELKIVGITNNTSQNFILSSKIERQIYKDTNIPKENFKAVRFKVQDFDKVANISENLRNKNIKAVTKASEIQVFKDTFNNLITMFRVLSYLIFVVGMLISLIVLYKILAERKSEMAILSAIGYKDTTVSKLLIRESTIVASATVIVSFGLLLITDILVKNILGYGLNITISKLTLLALLILTINILGTRILSKLIINKDKSRLLIK